MTDQERLRHEFGSITGGFFGGFENSSDFGPTPVSSVDKRRRRQRRPPVATLEAGWVGAATPVAARHIPAYDATEDPHCAYTQEGAAAFLASPFMQERRDAAALAARRLNHLSGARGGIHGMLPSRRTLLSAAA